MTDLWIYHVFESFFGLTWASLSYVVRPNKSKSSLRPTPPFLAGSSFPRHTVLYAYVTLSRLSCSVTMS